MILFIYFVGLLITEISCTDNLSRILIGDLPILWIEFWPEKNRWPPEFFMNKSKILLKTTISIKFFCSLCVRKNRWLPNSYHKTANWLPHARHHNPFLIRNRSWILAIHKDRISPKNLLENKEMVFKKWEKIYKPRIMMARVR